MAFIVTSKNKATPPPSERRFNRLKVYDESYFKAVEKDEKQKSDQRAWAAKSIGERTSIALDQMKGYAKQDFEKAGKEISQEKLDKEFAKVAEHRDKTE